MKTGTNYEEYMANIKKKNDAWNIVYDCFSMASDKFAVDILAYFDAIDDICGAGCAGTGELLNEEECVENIKSTISWLEGRLQWLEKYGNEDTRGYKRDKCEMKNLRRALKHKFGVDC